MRALSFPMAVLATAGLAVGQQQFMELAKYELPTDTDESWNVDAGDVDNDGDPDVVFANSLQNKIYINQGFGVFVDETATRFPVRAVNSREVELVDMDNDGDLDLWVANQGQNRLMLNDGAGVFTIAPLPRYRVWNEDVAIGDVDGDNDLDVYWAAQGIAPEAQNVLWLNDGNLGFTDVTATHLPQLQDGSVGVEFADFDADGDLDVVVGNGNGAEQNRLYLNDGTGRFTDATANLPQRNDFTNDVLVADLDLDNDPDIMFLNDGGDVGLLRNDGNLVFTAIAFPSSGTDHNGGATGDLDGDGDLDVMLVDWLGRNRIYLNDGALNFTMAPVSRTTQQQQQSGGVELVDVDDDQDLDAIVANYSTQNRLDMNLHRQIHTPLPAQIGASYDIDFYAQPGFITTPQTVVGLISLFPGPPQNIPPWGTLYIPPGSAVPMPLFNITPPTGKVSVNTSIVNDPNLVGVTIFIQAGILHSQNPADWRFSNLVRDQIQ